MLKVTRGLSGECPRAYPVATIGNFDGHHLGHRALLQTVVETARKAQGTALVLTFDPHPVKILAPHVDLRFLTSPEEKLAHLEAAGIDEVVFLDFTPTFAAMSPDQFAEDILHRSLTLSELFVGNHFAFGKGRAGRIDDLVRFGGQYGFRVHPVTPVMIEGDVVSSTQDSPAYSGRECGAGCHVARTHLWDSRYRGARDATGAGDGLAYGQSAHPG